MSFKLRDSMHKITDTYNTISSETVQQHIRIIYWNKPCHLRLIINGTLVYNSLYRDANNWAMSSLLLKPSTILPLAGLLAHIFLTFWIFLCYCSLLTFQSAVYVCHFDCINNLIRINQNFRK